MAQSPINHQIWSHWAMAIVFLRKNVQEEVDWCSELRLCENRNSKCKKWQNCFFSLSLPKSCKTISSQQQLKSSGHTSLALVNSDVFDSVAGAGSTNKFSVQIKANLIFSDPIDWKNLITQSECFKFKQQFCVKDRVMNLIVGQTDHCLKGT